MEPLLRREEAGLTPRAIYEELNRFVIGQDAAKRAVSIAAYNHAKRVEARRTQPQSLLKKSNILLIGPTGSGKTHIARQLARILSVPFATADATEYTEAGYYGKDVEVMVAELLLKANHSVEEAQKGIIFIDEVDKISRRSQSARNGAGARDIGGEGVQQALLKLLEGRELFVPLNVTQHWNKHDFVQVDTTDILFICAGTFSDLQRDSGEGRYIGFGEHRSDPPRPLRVKQLTEYGMLSEFLGRLPVMVQLERLTENELLRILTEPPDAVTREFQELLALDGIELSYRKDALTEIVRFAQAKSLGARGLRAVLEHVMGDVMYEAPEKPDRKLELTGEFVRRRLSTGGFIVH